MIAIGLAIAVVVVASVVALGRYVTVPPLPPAEVASAADGCAQFWSLMQTPGKSEKQLKAETLALSKGVRPFHEDLGYTMYFTATRTRPFTSIREYTHFVYRQCVNEIDWPPPTQEIANMREDGQSSAG